MGVPAATGSNFQIVILIIIIVKIIICMAYVYGQIIKILGIQQKQFQIISAIIMTNMVFIYMTTIKIFILTIMILTEISILELESFLKIIMMETPLKGI